MFIRESKTKNPRTGKVYLSHQLVETVQTEKGPRNRVLLYLGRLSLPKSSFHLLAKALENRLLGQSGIFPVEPEIQAVVEEAFRTNQPESLPRSGRNRTPKPTGTAVVACDSLETGEVRSLGGELAGHQAWERLSADAVLIASGFSPRERALAQAVVVGRLVSPGSELHTHRWLTTRSAIGELVGQEVETVGKDAVYEIGDRLWEAREAIERAFCEQTRENFPSDRLIFLYDLTNTYLEGGAKANPLAKRGHSKEKRTDCPLIGLSLVVDQRGFPIQSHVTPGNQAEPETLPALLERLERLPAPPALLPPGKPTLIMDRGIATEANIALLKEKRIPYCVIERRAAGMTHADSFATARESFAWFAPDPASPEEGVFLRKLPPKEGTVDLLVLSETRKAKEESMDDRRETRFLSELDSLRDRVAKGGAGATMERVLLRLGRLQGRYSAIAKYYQVVVHPRTSAPPVPEKKGRKTPPTPLRADRVEWEKKPGRETRRQTTGAYVIQTTHIDLSDQEIWSLYMTITRVEAAFRSLKTDLGLRPVFHQTADRVRAHLFIAVLAYHLLADIEVRMQQARDPRRWSTLRNLLSTHVRQKVSGQDPHTLLTHTVRLSSTPEPAQKALYKILGIKDPTRRVWTKTRSPEGAPSPAT
ncbi:MAG: IS1634 family transposase [Leptospirales bacterium]